MNDEDESLIPSRPPADTGSPGLSLREAREQAGLSIEELSSRTRIARQTLEAMEADEFEALLEPVYVRGYYRKCAQVLEIDDRPLVEAYTRLYTPPPTPAPARLRLAPSGDLDGSSRISGFRMGIVAPIILIVLIGAVWLVLKAPTTRSIDESVTLIDPDDPGVIVSDALPPVDEEEEVFTAESSIDTAAPVEETAASPATSSTALELQFKSLSWARVKDAQGQSLLSGVIAEGETHRLEGKPPYSVFLGNAPGVTVRFGGTEIDTKPHTDSNAAARFTVPAAGN